jgi:hypothetical protein
VLFVLGHQSGIAHNVGEHDGGKFSLLAHGTAVEGWKEWVEIRLPKV